MSDDDKDGMDPEDWAEQFNRLSEGNVALIESLRTQLEEQKALVARLTVSAQQDAAILKAAREVVVAFDNANKIMDAEDWNSTAFSAACVAACVEEQTTIAALCKAVRGEKE